jgi:hypothetical protein
LICSSNLLGSIIERLAFEVTDNRSGV